MAESLFKTIGTYKADNLIAGLEYPILEEGVTLAKGQGVLKRGTVIGVISASGLAKPVDSTKSDGMQIPKGILTDDIDTGDGSATTDSKTTLYITGLFNKNALIFGGTDTATTHIEALKDRGIFLKDTIAY